MNTPIQFGFPQIVLILLAIVGVGLFISALMGLVGGKLEQEIFEDEYGRRYHRWRKKRRQFHFKRGVGGLIVLIFALSLVYLTFAVQAYIGLNSDIKVAQVQAMSVSNENHTMFVNITMYNVNGQATSHGTYSVLGDRWMLQGDIMKFPTWMNFFGIHSGYKVTALEGQYANPQDESNDKHTVIVLNGGDGDFFKTVYKQAWSSPFVDAAYGNAVIVPADGQTYNVYVSQTGLYAKLASK
ncbi:MAG TPA: hypothetical protein VL461_13875 [Dictyobacter sp.]|nr:hypothetical protein [Dictyobacter sp.]